MVPEKQRKDKVVHRQTVEECEKSLALYIRIEINDIVRKIDQYFMTIYANPTDKITGTIKSFILVLLQIGDANTVIRNENSAFRL
jgi:hypothetical protein